MLPGTDRLPLEGGADVSVDADAAPSGEAGEASGEGGCAFAGLQAYFPFDGDYADHSGNGASASATGTTFTSGGPLGGKALYFSTNSFVTLSGSHIFVGARTLCAWIKPFQAAGLALPVFTGGVPMLGDFFSIQPSTPPNPVCGPAGAPFVDDWGSGNGCRTAAEDVKTGAWSFLCFAYDGAQSIEIGVNGGSATVTQVLQTWGESSIDIGSNEIGGTSSVQSFVGEIGEVSIWNVQLAVAQVQALYRGGSGCKVR
jgi:hypothetical protein